MFSSPSWRGVRVSLSTSLQGGTPYNVTTGRDDNGDTVFTDRPEGVGRNSARGKGSWDAGARVSYAFGFGQRDDSGPQGGPIVIVQRVGPGADSGGMLGAFGGGGAENKRLRIELFAQAQNLFNHVNPIGYSGVMTSPFFGQPTAALPGRRVEVGARLAF